MGKRAVLASVLRVRRAPVTGRCTVCGRLTIFVWVDANVRDGLACPSCWSVARHRLVAKTLLEALGQAGSLSRLRSLDAAVYIADRHGPLMRGLAHVRDAVTTSDLIPGYELGAHLPGGGTCQDLEQLTFPDASFDVVVTEDVLEHVRRPDSAFAEIHRVLRPGGVHVFTVPFAPDAPTLTRVDTSGEDDVLLMEPEWHGDSVRGRILAYRRFGHDIFDQLERHGFTVSLRRAGYWDRRQGIFDAEVFVARRHC